MKEKFFYFSYLQFLIFLPWSIFNFKWNFFQLETSNISVWFRELIRFVILRFTLINIAPQFRMTQDLIKLIFTFHKETTVKFIRKQIPPGQLHANWGSFKSFRGQFYIVLRMILHNYNRNYHALETYDRY